MELDDEDVGIVAPLGMAAALLGSLFVMWWLI
jgi:hypothetical protein